MRGDPARPGIDGPHADTVRNVRGPPQGHRPGVLLPHRRISTGTDVGVVPIPRAEQRPGPRVKFDPSGETPATVRAPGSRAPLAIREGAGFRSGGSEAARAGTPPHPEQLHPTRERRGRPARPPPAPPP